MLNIFGKKNMKASGWMSIMLTEDGVRAAYISRIALNMPVVERIGFYPPVRSGRQHGEQPLDVLNKEWRASYFQCTTLLNFKEYRLLTVDAPSVPRDELKTAIRWRLKDMLDFHVDDATIDVFDMPVSSLDPSKAPSVFVVAARNQIIRQRQSQFFSAQLGLQVIDIPDLAQRNISELLEEDEAALALLSFDAEGSLLTVTHRGELYLSRRIDISFSQLVHHTNDVRDVIFDKITLELQRSFDYFDRQFPAITVTRLLLAPCRQETGLIDYLKINLYIPVDTFDLSNILDLTKTPNLKELDKQQDYFFAIGAALRTGGIA